MNSLVIYWTIETIYYNVNVYIILLFVQFMKIKFIMYIVEDYI